MLRSFLFLILILPFVVVPVTSHASDPENAANPELTALYLYNFLLFVDWPKDACLVSNAFSVTILGAPRVYEAMKTMSGKRVKGKKLAIFSPAGTENMDDSCQVLFVGHMEPDVVRDSLKKVKGKPVLTVGDMPGFIALGGMVSLNYPDDLRKSEAKRKRFRINLSAFEASRLKIRSRLLRISDIVSGNKPVTRKKP